MLTRDEEAFSHSRGRMQQWSALETAAKGYPYLVWLLPKTLDVPVTYIACA